MIGTLLFAAMAPAQTNIDFARWAMSKSEARRESDAVAVELELWVGPDGKVEGCNVARFAGTEAAAKNLCDQTVGQRVTPARDAQGSASYGVARATVVAARDDVQVRNDLRRALDGSAPIEDVVLAEGVGAPLEYYTVLVDSEGEIGECQASADAPAESAAAVCGELAGEQRPVRLSKAGAAVAYVERLRVRYAPPPAMSAN